MTLSVGVLMDPIGAIKIAKDTSFAMLLEARRRGHALHYFEQGDLALRDGAPWARMAALDVREPPWLFGHSDGGSIALIHAASFPARVAGLVVVAPHIDVEPVALAGLRAAREAYATTDLRGRLARYHDDVDSAFGAWNDSWLAPAFETTFDLKPLLPAIACPLLAVQGEQDEYATLEQIRGIARLVPQAELLELAHCGHSPHRDQPDRLVDATVRFLAAHGA